MIYENNIPYATLKTLLIVIGTLGMMCSTTTFGKSAKRIALIFFLYLCYVASFSAAIYFFFGYTVYLRTFLFTISSPAIYLVFRLAKDQPSRAVFNHATQILFSLYVSASITLINTAVHGSEITDFLMRLAAYCIIILLEWRFLRRPFLRLASITQNGWLILALVPCSLMVLSVVLASYPVPYTQNPTNIIFIYLLGAVIVIIYFAMFQYLLMQYRFQTANQNLEFLKFQVGNLKEKISMDAIAAEKTQIDRHDIRHRLQALSALLEEGKTAEALDYIAQSTRQFDTKTPVTYCTDVLLNATLSSYFAQAKKSGIVLKTHLSIPDTLPADSGEFSIVIANALENAIKACCCLPEGQRTIICKCIYRPRLMLEISNPCSGTVAFSEDGMPLSKEDEHGIGTRSIMAFCKKYDALCSFTAEDGWFTLKVVL